ncbi:MAG: right-handed parallel beta-helix repeat-containing protein [Xanthomonadales bacterium]|nr:right-handed parallel beta-helix repeat-containing protein [Xanthomonadales bacterium]
MNPSKRNGVLCYAASLLALLCGPLMAATDCAFTNSGSTMSLDADCTTDETIYVPDGWTLDGGGHSITAVDPDGDHFRGAVVANEGAAAHVTSLVVQTSGLANACDGGDDRLRGILFEGASGSITQNTVQNINQGASGCQEGNAIEVRNAPFDGTHPNTVAVDIEHNVVETYQKTGVVCNGDADCTLRFNFVGESATQANLAANSIQYGFGATGVIEHNHVAGNQWLGASDYSASAVLLYEADGTVLQKNNIGGNSDVGVYLLSDGAVVDNNRIFDGGPDGNQTGYDIGLGDWGTGNTITNNKIRGFDDPTNADGQHVISGAAPNPVCFGTGPGCGEVAE